MVYFLKKFETFVIYQDFITKSKENELISYKYYSSNSNICIRVTHVVNRIKATSYVNNGNN